MSETQNNPLNDFINQDDERTANSLFADFPFSEPTEEPAEQQTSQTAAAPVQPVQTVLQLTAPNPPAEESTEVENKEAGMPIFSAQTSLYAEAAAKTPASAEPLSLEEAINIAKAKSDSRLVGSFSKKEAIFCYGKAKDPITDHDCTFEELRAKYETDFPELADSKKVSWKVLYGKTTKSIPNPGAVKVYDMKAEIEKSKQFIENIKKAKTDADKNPECLVKPYVIAQSKGEARIPLYKDYCLSVEDAQASDKAIVILPSQDGKIYERRETPVGTFMAPAVYLPEFPLLGAGFQMTLPKIPMHILMFILNFFEEISERYEAEVLVHILYDTLRCKYTMRVPKQEITHISVNSVMEEEYPEHFIHVMDIHSHNTMPAKFSDIDDKDEKATRLYAVVGKIDQVFPEITVRASCAGKFIPIQPEEVFETNFKAFPYPSTWNEQITFHKSTPSLPEQGKSRCWRFG